jgi:uncharacterized protein (DUF1499 family)
MGALITGLTTLSWLAFAGGAACAHFGAVTPIKGFLVTVIGALLSLLTIVVAIVPLVRGKLDKPYVAYAGFVPFVLILASLVPASRFPRINDITTDLNNPPAFTHAKTLPDNANRNMDYPEKFEEIVKESYPDLKPLELPIPPDQAYTRALAAAKQLPGVEITTNDPAAHTFEGVCITWLFQFRDDFVVRVAPEGGGSRIDVRSKSRVGQGDLGANASRIRQLFDLVIKQT